LLVDDCLQMVKLAPVDQGAVELLWQNNTLPAYQLMVMRQRLSWNAALNAPPAVHVGVWLVVRRMSRQNVSAACIPELKSPLDQTMCEIVINWL
jgi:hypothetical protein